MLLAALRIQVFPKMGKASGEASESGEAAGPTLPMEHGR